MIFHTQQAPHTTTKCNYHIKYSQQAFIGWMHEWNDNNNYHSLTVYSISATTICSFCVSSSLLFCCCLLDFLDTIPNVFYKINILLLYCFRNRALENLSRMFFFFFCVFCLQNICLISGSEYKGMLLVKYINENYYNFTVYAWTLWNV